MRIIDLLFYPEALLDDLVYRAAASPHIMLRYLNELLEHRILAIAAGWARGHIAQGPVALFQVALYSVNHIENPVIGQRFHEVQLLLKVNDVFFEGFQVGFCTLSMDELLELKMMRQLKLQA